MSIGLEDGKGKKKINLTQLRRNVRTRVEKKSGRKAPRPGDYDIMPAPDACVSIRSIIHAQDLMLLYYYNIRNLHRRCHQSLLVKM